ncbi:hypothetical protein FB446DRAFT_656007, partial [Lentinula raphanica]
MQQEEISKTIIVSRVQELLFLNIYILKLKGNDEEKKLQDWLAAPDCSTNFATALNQIVAGTGQWIFKNSIYVEWEEKGTILWVQGKAIFCSTNVINNLQNAKFSSLVIYHYFDIRDNIGTKTSFQGFLSSLLLQLGVNQQSIHPALKKLHESSKYGLSFSKPTDNKLADTLKQIIKDIIQQKHQLFIIIDALDECKKSSAILSLVTEIASSHLVKILISSRNHYPDSLKSLTISLTGNTMVDQDIATFVEAEMSIQNKNLEAEVKKELMQKASGGFRYIDCQVQLLRKCANARKVHQALQQLPVTLSEIYTEAIGKCQKSFHFEEVHHLLLWLLYSFEPLHISQVAIIFSIDLSSLKIGFETKILIELGEIVDTTLVTIDSKQIVQLAHPSVKDFLLNSQFNIHAKNLLVVNAQLGHNVIAQMCLIYLLQQTNLEATWVQSETLEEFKTFRRYATYYWAIHGKHNERDQVPNEQTMKLTLEFLQKDSRPFCDWTRSYCINGNEKINLEGSDPIHIAAFFGLKESAHRICSNIIVTVSRIQNMNKMSMTLGSPVQAASWGGDYDIVELLLKCGADVNIQGGYWGGAIQVASAVGSRAIVELLLKNNADVNAQEGELGTAIEQASFFGHNEVIELLLKHGADLNAHAGKY